MSAGPGLPESTYETCLAYELRQRDWNARQVKIPIVYKSIRLKGAYRADLLVNSAVIVEVKSIEKIDPIHVAQLLTYLKHSGCPVGLLFNFKVELLIEGIRRVIND
jgi:GxxExxY protein